MQNSNPLKSKVPGVKHISDIIFEQFQKLQNQNEMKSIDIVNNLSRCREAIKDLPSYGKLSSKDELQMQIALTRAIAHFQKLADSQPQQKTLL